MVYVLDGGGPKHSENTLKAFLTKNKENVFWEIGTDMQLILARPRPSKSSDLPNASWLYI